MGTFFQDLRFALRQLRKAPSFAATAVLTLALGVGANTAIFSLVNSLLLKPLPVPNPKQIATLVPRENHGPLGQGLSWNEFKQVRSQSGRSFSDVFAWTLNLDGLAVKGQQPERIVTAYVSGNFFEGLGLKPAAGRLFLRSEGEILGHDPVIVLGYDYWQQRFNGDPSIVGRPVTLDGHPVTIIGVAPKDFGGMQTFVTMAAYLPLSEIPIVAGTPVDAINDWQNRMFNVQARLRSGASLEQASAALTLVAQEIARLHPDVEKKLNIEAFPEPQLRVNSGNPNTLLIVAGLFLSLALMVLLLACVNVANLVMVRATAREREMAIRTALGAQRSRLIRQMITESVMLALIGGGMGVVMGMGASGALTRLDLHTDLPVKFVFDFDWRIFFYSLAIALLAGVVVGIVPALRIAKSNVNTFLHEGSRGIASGRHWLRDSLVALQIAGSLVLLVVAALFVRSLSAMQTMDFGFKPDHVMNFALDAHEIGMNDGEARDLAASITARLHLLAGVDYVSHASSVPMSILNNGDRMVIDEAPVPADPNDLNAGYNVVSPEYFSVMGIDLLRGRAFIEADNEHSKDVAVISETTARKFWPNQDPIGRTFRMAGEKDRKLQIVGIAHDALFQIYAGGKSQPYFYVPYAQHFKGNTLMVFQLRSNRDLLSLTPAAEKTIHSLAPQLPIFQVQTMREGLDTTNGLLLFRIGASLAAIMGGLGLTLAVIGLYGVVSYAVGRRIHEIGVRIALGASRGSVFRMIYRQSVVIVAVGLAFGVGLALLVAQAVRGFVTVSVWDPATYIVVGIVLATAALASCYFPARYATNVEPMVALRED
jgi:predicted permease